MRSFYKSTYWLWVTLKFILMILLFIESFRLLRIQNLNSQEFLVNSLGLAEAILLLITLIHDFSTTNLKYLKIISGIFLIIGGILLFSVLMSASKGSRNDFFFLGYVLAIIIFMIGIFDILHLEKPYDPYN